LPQPRFFSQLRQELGILSASVVPWRSVPRAALQFREWDDHIVVRNDQSGSTHLLGPLAGRVLQMLVEGDCAKTINDLAARLNEEPSEVDGSDWPTAIEAILSEFQRLGLAEPEST
jgi:PqqD family protein of HPr-rel-A system